MIRRRPSVIGTADGLGQKKGILLQRAERNWPVDRYDAKSGAAAIKHGETFTFPDAFDDPGQFVPKCLGVDGGQHRVVNK